jgi:hypothetical protein
MNIIKLILQYKCFRRKHFGFILFGKHTNQLFGIQITIGHFIFQHAFGKIGIFNCKTYKWAVDI